MKNEENIKTVGLIALLGIGALFLLSKSKKQQPSKDVALTLAEAAAYWGYGNEIWKIEDDIAKGRYSAFEKDGVLYVWKSHLDRYSNSFNPSTQA